MVKPRITQTTPYDTHGL